MKTSYGLLFCLAIVGTQNSKADSACWDETEKESGIDRYLLHAVSDVESGHNAIALAVAKKGLWLTRQPKTISQAISWAEWLNIHGYTFAIGSTQINWRVHGKFLESQGITMKKLYCDPCLQIKNGARILRDCFDREGVSWNNGVGCYYTGPGKNKLPWDRYEYAKKVYARYVYYKRMKPELTVSKLLDPVCDTN